jgi:predicted secreted Zn-dependent protease
MIMASNKPTPYNPQSNRFDNAIERLWMSALPGQVVTATEIAKECGVTRAAIEFRVKVILKKLRNKHAEDKELIELLKTL